jgi:hypothetical protein
MSDGNYGTYQYQVLLILLLQKLKNYDIIIKD